MHKKSVEKYLFVFGVSLLLISISMSLVSAGLLDDINNYLKHIFGIRDNNLGGELQESSILGTNLTQENKLISYWKFDGNALDSAGTNNGIVNGAVLTTGISGQAYSFDGVNDYIDCGTNLILQDQMTISAWVNWNKFYNDSGGHAFISKSYKAKNGFMLYQTTNSPYNKANFFIKTNGEDNSAGGQSQELETNKWHYITLTYNGVEASLYINGEKILVNPANGGINFSEPQSSLLFGSTYTTTGAKFNGTLDEVKIWNYALTADEIKNEYNLIIPPVVKNCSDGTLYGSCSASKPKYCDNGNLINNCSLCGCLAGCSCQQDGSCQTAACTNDTGCTSAGSFCSGNMPYNCTLGGDKCLDRVNKSICGSGYICSNGICQVIAGNKLISYWKFDGNALDSAGTNDGIVNGSTLTTGISGQAYSFDGVNDYISTSEQDKLDTWQSGTISAWIKCNTTCPLGAIISYASKSQASSNFILRVNNNVLEYAWNPMISVSWNIINSTNKINDDKWHYVVFVADGASRIRMYLDGIEQTTIFSKLSGRGYESDWIADLNLISSTGHHISMGVLDRSGPANWFKGSIDEVKIWNYALTADEIKNEYEKIIKPAVKNCSDGTLHGACSTNKPKYCSNGFLINSCNFFCGCPVDYACQADNSCKLVEPTAKLNISIATLKDIYKIGEQINLTDS